MGREEREREKGRGGVGRTNEKEGAEEYEGEGSEGS